MARESSTLTGRAGSGSDSGATLRAYGGEGGDTRVARRRSALIDAGLDLLGAGENATVTVRGVCRQAGLTARYFYESFESVDELVGVLYDEVISELADAGLRAFDEGSDMESKVRGGVTAMVDIIAADQRKGRLLFSQSLQSPVIAAKRMESTTLFAGLTLQSASGVIDLDPELGSGAAFGIAHYQVGGLSRLLAAWVEGDVDMTRDAIVDLSVRLLLAPAELFHVHGLIDRAGGGRSNAAESST
ncbi:TetR/AcrR family transcriptional regulator [Gordonia bronchialis]|uniref:TetR/AcrR family transcriptional regulator n=1 Tax=Gordonia bronchialis TaxID=2054 RepID=UPI001CC026C9|nr:TetR/AcrR family transcriptional regulator [Gordonia bronchialis]UAK36695.1 TetR/AcrR family transcriptional regulator [Gordonia bronchialis]